MIYDCVIIGSGVAGLTAALYVARANKSVMIIEDSVIGGTTATLDLIENYPGVPATSGLDLVQKMLQQVSALGVNIDLLQIESIDFDKKIIHCDNANIEYKTLIIATGTSNKKLGLDEEKKFQFRGLSYCAVCDGNLFKNKKVVVATKGNTGKESINYLANLTNNLVVVDSTSVYKSDKAEVLSDARITSILGKNSVEAIKVESKGKELDIDCSGVFVALGKETNLKLFENKITIENGYICADENMHTNIPGVFVAGDVRKKTLRQIVTACSDGAIAGTEAIKYLTKIN